MSRTASEAELSLSVREFLDSMRGTNEPVVLDANGDTVAVVLSRDKYERLLAAEQEEWDRLWAVVDAVHERNEDLDPDEVLRAVTEDVEEVRKELYDEWRSGQGRR
ncbi:MAG TPA: hypothetical protein VMM78_07700 [Thermomicrobiales bacterium]|nr:hypothetical protein [Thermomicrobiales bacterium]